MPPDLERRLAAMERRLATLAEQAPGGDRLAGTCQELQAVIAELQAAEQEQRRWRDLFELAPDGYVVTDRAGMIGRANRAAGTMLGTAPAALCGRPLDRYVTEPSQAVLDTLLAAEGVGGTPARAELKLQPPGGEPLAVVASLVTPGDRPHERWWLLHDVSSRRLVDEELLRSRHLEGLASIAGGLAHDFNNYLGGIVGSLTLARRQLGASATSVLPTIQAAETAALEARRLSNQLLTFARGGSPVRETAALGEVIRETASFALRGSGASAGLDIAPDLWPVEVDLAQLNQALTNLLLNAAQALPHGGVVQITARNITIPPTAAPLPPGRYIRITIRDRGVGIPPDDLARVFDPYFSTKVGGTGLGLPITYSIVKRHQGHLDLSSHEGEGTTVTLTLPAAEAPVEPKPESPGEPGGRILFVDDEFMIRAPFAALLELMGYEVDHAESGEQAVALYHQARERGRPYAAVIMDLTMPGGISGQEATRRILDEDPAARVVVASGYSNDAAMANYREHGFRAAVAKPYTAEGLAAALREALAEPAST